MANIYFNQVRSIDPYSSYNSDVVNTYTRTISFRRNCIHGGPGAFDITEDPNGHYRTLILSPGFVFKDDVLIQNTASFSIDMSAKEFYVDSSNGWWNEAGTYYVCLSYVFAKANPAPKASIQIFKPSQLANYNATNYLFIKAVTVSFSSDQGQYIINSLYDYDPNSTSIQRMYAYSYVEAVNTLPTSFDSTVDEGRLIYVKSENDIYYGSQGLWVSLTGWLDFADTSSCSIGQLGYVNASGVIASALATDQNTLAECIVMSVGTRAARTGTIRTTGIAAVQVESSITISKGSLCYLSAKETGKITNVQPTLSQYVGKAITDSASGLVFLEFLTSGSSSPSIAITRATVVVTDQSTMPTVIDGSSHQAGRLVFANTAATTVTNFINGTPGQGIILEFSDSNTTIQNNSSIILAKNINFSPSGGDMMMLIYNGTVWKEVSRMLYVYKEPTVSAAVNTTLLISDSGKTFIFDTANAYRTVNLPDASANSAIGLKYTIIKQGNGILSILAAATNHIADSVTGGCIVCYSEGQATITLQVVKAGLWNIIAISNVWMTDPV